jgi:nucleotide-binding universal stress UspA family protein
MIPTTYVVPLDGSPFAERAVPVAAALAERVGGGLLLVSATVHGPLEPKTYLEGVSSRITNVPVETIAHLDHVPSEAILDVTSESDDRVVCMTSHGGGRLRWSMLGSTAEEVVRRAERPLVLVGRHCRPDFLAGGAHMLVCVDDVHSSARVAPVAREWAEQFGLEVDAAVVVHPRDVENLEHPELVLDPIVELFGGPDRVHAHMLSGAYAAGALADLADELPSGMVAMSCHGRVGLARVALGSVTMALLQLVSCPLLVTSCGAQ